MLDMEHTVFLWQGWWPEVSDESENVETGSAHARLYKERHLAMETTLLYCKSTCFTLRLEVQFSGRKQAIYAI